MFHFITAHNDDDNEWIALPNASERPSHKMSAVALWSQFIDVVNTQTRNYSGVFVKRRAAVAAAGKISSEKRAESSDNINGHVCSTPQTDVYFEEYFLPHFLPFLFSPFPGTNPGGFVGCVRTPLGDKEFF